MDWTRFCRWQCMLVDLNDGTLCMVLCVCNFYMNLWSSGRNCLINYGISNPFWLYSIWPTKQNDVSCNKLRNNQFWIECNRINNKKCEQTKHIRHIDDKLNDHEFYGGDVPQKGKYTSIVIYLSGPFSEIFPNFWRFRQKVFDSVRDSQHILRDDVWV